MDKPLSPTPGERRLILSAAGEAWSWRLAMPDGACVAGRAPDPDTARRSAVFAACAVAALARTQRRWF